MSLARAGHLETPAGDPEPRAGVPQPAAGHPEMRAGAPEVSAVASPLSSSVPDFRELRCNACFARAMVRALPPDWRSWEHQTAKRLTLWRGLPKLRRMVPVSDATERAVRCLDEDASFPIAPRCSSNLASQATRLAASRYVSEWLSREKGASSGPVTSTVSST